MKQITYVIVNRDGEMYAGVTTDHIWWTKLIINATLFENIHLANIAIKKCEIEGIIMRMNYTLSPITDKSK